MVAPADAAAQLVELGEAEAFCVVEDHEGGVGDVDADLDDGGGDECRELAVTEFFHDVFFMFGWEFPVDESYVFGTEAFLPFFEGGGGREGLDVFRFFDKGVDEVGLAAVFEVGFDEVRYVYLFGFDAEGGGDFAAAGWFFIEYGDVEISIEGHGECAGDGCCSHDEDIGQGAVGDECGALEDAEFVLFIDDDEAEIVVE